MLEKKGTSHNILVFLSFTDEKLEPEKLIYLLNIEKNLKSLINHQTERKDTDFSSI